MSGRHSGSARRVAGSLAVALMSAVAFAACGDDTGTGSSGAGTTAVEKADAPTTTPGPEASASDAAGGTGVGVGTASADTAGDLHPDVLAATAQLDADGTWTVAATLSSPYDSAERYADAWRVVGPDGDVYGIRELTHDHASEQPFTRSQSGIDIPPEVDVITIEGRDQLNGWGGATVDVFLER